MNIFNKISIVTIFVLSLFAFANSVSANAYCANGSTMTLQEFAVAKRNHALTTSFTFNTNNVVAHVSNTTGCSAPLVGSTYKVYVATGIAGFLSTQQFIGETSVNINANGNTDITLPRASCRTQADIWYQMAPHTLQDGLSYTGPGLPYILEGQVGTDPLCTNQASFAVSCQVFPTTANINSNVDWSALASGGAGSYTYSWTGTDGLTGSSQTISKAYSTSGTKTGTVTVTSGGETKTANCSMVVNPPQVNALYVSCYANYSSAQTGTNINWNANATGGTGSYTYSWSGTDGLSGSSQTASMSYSNTGSKQATVLVTSGGLSASATCNTNIYAVQSYYQNQDAVIGGSCTANISNTQTGTNVTWSANAYGGNNYYTYYWTGSDGLYGSGQYIYKTYNTAGQKYANVTITSGGQSITRSCEVNVGQVLSYVQTAQLPTLSSVYLSDLPYTGIEDYKMPLFVAGLSLWSLIIAMIIYKMKGDDWVDENKD